MDLFQLCGASGLNCPESAKPIEVSAITADSREVTQGSLFVCIDGLHVDGHDYLPEAIRAGAVAAVVGKGFSGILPEGFPLVEAEDTRVAFSCLCNAFFGNPAGKLKLIGVTGTNGKTTVTHMLRYILESSLCRCGLIGTVGCESAGRHLDSRSHNPLANMTTPDPPELYRMLAEMAEDRVEYVIMEVTSHALVLGKLAPILFEAAIFTNLTPEHLDFHKTMDAYADAKATLFSKSKLSVINTDSRYANRMMWSAEGKIVTCSAAGRNADYTAEEITRLPDGGTEYALTSANSRILLTCPIPGDFSVMNSMQAAVTALELGFGAVTVKTAIATLSGIKGRMERVRLGLTADFRVMIDYAHTPDALENLLRSARQISGEGRLVLLFGCGGNRDTGKRPLMGRLAATLADRVIVTSDNSRDEEPEEIIGQILSGFPPEVTPDVIPSREEAIRFAIRTAERGDLILLAGKGHEEYEIDRNGRRPFNERAIALDEFRIRNRERGKGKKQTEP